jgi:hypothetical protein
VPVYGVPENLKPYHTSKKDIEEGLEVIPQEMYRLRREDIYKSGQKRAAAMTMTPKPLKKMKCEDMETQETIPSKRSNSATKNVI